MKKNTLTTSIFLLVTLSINLSFSQKSVFVISNINETPTPIQAWGIQGSSLFFQAEYDVPDWGNGAVGLAVDVDSAFLFVTYENSNVIQLIDATTMTGQGTVNAPGAVNLAGIVYDNTNSHIYAVDRMTDKLYSYIWDAGDKTLILENMYVLDSAYAWGITLNQSDSLLYVANYNFDNSSSYIAYYNTTDWSLAGIIDSLVYGNVVNVEIDVANNLLYYGGIVAGNNNLARYNLLTGEQNAIQMEPNAGIMGMTFDDETGILYTTTGFEGDDIRAFNSSLSLLFQSETIGNPTDIVTGNVGYNPCYFEVETDECAFKGEEHSFELCYKNPYNAPATNIIMKAEVPDYCDFVSATGGGIYHQDINTVIWEMGNIPPQTALTCNTLTVEVEQNAPFPCTLTINAMLDGDSIGTVPIGPAYYSHDFFICQIPTCHITGDQTICNGDYAQLILHLTGSPPWKIIYSDGISQTTIEDIVQSEFYLYVSPETTSTYNVVYVEGAHGLSNTGTGSATVNVLQSVIPELEGPFELCLYDSPVSYSTPLEIGTTYEWNVTGGTILNGQFTNSIVVDWTQPCTGIIEVVQKLLSTGCEQSDAGNVFVYDVPVINFGFNDTILCPVGDTIALFPQYYTDSSSLLWTCSDISSEWNNYTGDTIKVYTTGVGFYSAVYYLHITTENGCTDADSVEVTFDFDVCDNNIREINKEKSILIYPLPATDFINVKIDNRIDLPLNVTIFDSNGKLVQYDFVNKRKTKIRLSQVNGHIYFIRFWNDDIVFTTKIITE